MAYAENPDHEERNTGANPQPPIPVSEPHKQRVFRKSNSHRSEKNIEPPERRIRERAQFAVNLILVIVGIVAVCIYGGQLAVMKGQLGEMAGSGKQTDQLICLYQQQLTQLTKQAGDTHDLADAAAKQADRTKDLADRMKDQADRTKTMADQAVISANAADSSARTAKQILDQDIRSSKLDRRPWVGIQETSGGPIISGGNVTPGATIDVRNTGKTPALKLTGMYAQVVTEIRDPVPDYDEIESGRWAGKSNSFLGYLFSSGDVLPPEASRKLHMGIVTYRSRTVEEGFPRIFYIVGKITYEDSDGGSLHTTKFCLSNVERNQATFVSCSTGNSMD